MKIDHAIEQVCDAEAALGDDLRLVGERHAVDADVYHVAHVLSARCRSQIERLRSHAGRYGADEPELPEDGSPVVERLRRLSSDLLGKHEVAGMLLLDDLRDLYLTAHRAELAWVVLLQAARAARDEDLAEAAKAGREEAERRWKWLRTRIKESAPQVLVAG
jgi:hypothetical protein